MTRFPLRPSFEKTPAGVIVSTRGPAKKVHLELISDAILHVTAFSGDKTELPPSLMVVAKPSGQVPFDVTDADGKVTLKATHLSASIDEASGGARAGISASNGSPRAASSHCIMTRCPSRSGMNCPCPRTSPTPSIIMWWRVNRSTTPSRLSPDHRQGGAAAALGLRFLAEPPVLSADAYRRMTLNDSWGFNRGDHAWKTAHEVIDTLAAIARGGGNYLLNIGPMPDGTVPEPSVKILTEVGGWLQRNGAGKAIAFDQNERGLRLTGLPDLPPDQPVTVIEIECEGAVVLDHVSDRKTWKRGKA